MNPSNRTVKKIEWRWLGVIVVAVGGGAGVASADTFQHGGSTTTIEQRGGQGPSHSQILRDPEGQTIITHDGASTDITVQRRAGVPSPDDGEAAPPAGSDRFDRPGMEQRCQRPAPAKGSAKDPAACPAASARAAFRQRMLERLRRPAW